MHKRVTALLADAGVSLTAHSIVILATASLFWCVPTTFDVVPLIVILGITQVAAVTPPRVSTLRTLNDVVGSTDPVLIDWLPGFVFPCQHPVAVTNGVLEVPQWRIMPDAEATRKNSQTWMSGTAGGPLGITEAMLVPTLLPTYLRNNWGRDWGGLQRFTEIAPAPPAELDLGTARRSGRDLVLDLYAADALLQIADDPAAIPLFVLRCAWIVIGHAIP